VNEFYPDIMFSDFFKPPPKPFYSRESNGRKSDAPPKKKKSAFDDMDMDEDDAGSDLEDDDHVENEEDQTKIKDLFADDDKEEGDEVGKSAHEKRLERVKQQIEEFEMQNVGQKDWTLGGEASAKARPLNSLLEEDLEFDHAAKPVPVITQETTETLEDMIKKRIVEVS
jgi:U3 small nucleolar RNA-associated protein MPP10